MALEEVQGGQPAVSEGGAPAPGPAPGGGGGLEGRLEQATGGVDGGGEQTLAPVATPAATPQPTAAEWQGVRDYARSQGVELPWEDDTQALGNLLQSYRQLQERNWYADLGRRVAPQADQIRKFLEQQAPAAGPPQAWQAPPFRREWLQMVETDPETGALRAKAGYDPALADKVRAYADWRDGFLQAPETIIGPLAEERARAIVQQELAQHREAGLAESLVQREASWVFAGGRPGNRLTPAGQMYGRALEHFYRGGLRDVRALHAASVALVQNAFLRQAAQQRQPAAAAVAPGVPAATPAMAGELPTSVAGALGRGGSSAPPAGRSAAGGPVLSLRDRLMNKMGGAQAVADAG